MTVLKQERPESGERIQSHSRLHDLDACVQEHALVERSDLLESITVDGNQYGRLGLDRVSTGYYARDRPDSCLRIIAVDHAFLIQESTLVRKGRLGALFDHINHEVGSRGIENEWVDQAQAVASRGGSA